MPENGMKRKKTKREYAKRWTDEGLPRDAKDWAEEDWRDLHVAMEEVKRRVARRHRDGSP
jgi:hypothetical protein